MMEDELTIDTNEIGDYFYKELIKRGFAPGKKEVEEIADIVFEYMVSIGVIEVVDE